MPLCSFEQCGGRSCLRRVAERHATAQRIAWVKSDRVSAKYTRSHVCMLLYAKLCMCACVCVCECATVSRYA